MRFSTSTASQVWPQSPCFNKSNDRNHPMLQLLWWKLLAVLIRADSCSGTTLPPRPSPLVLPWCGVLLKFLRAGKGSLFQHSLETYHFSIQAIILKISLTDQSEAVHRAISRIFENWTMGQESRLVGTGGAGIQGYTRIKYPNGFWKPTSRLPRRGLEWTEVVESVWSESLAKLEDSLFWLNESDRRSKSWP